VRGEACQYRGAVAEDADGDERCGADALPKGAVALELFTMIATLGTPQDITLQELRIESFFPMDADTARVLRAWAKPKRARARQSGPRSGQPQIGQL
jgi:hypothetical protein